jgi:hypothetical protein
MPLNDQDRMQSTQKTLPEGIKVIEYLGNDWFVIEARGGHKFYFRHWENHNVVGDLLLPYGTDEGE